MSKRGNDSSNRLIPDPSAPSVRDPEQKGDELQRHPTPRREDPTQKNHHAATPERKPQRS
jgi:hypothetical protein